LFVQDALAIGQRVRNKKRLGKAPIELVTVLPLKGGKRVMGIEELKDLARRKAMAIVGTSMTNDEATRQQIAKNQGLEMIEPQKHPVADK
jgi:hypothetical protein